jgi:glycosyltransferase involved in cell wall biosynthesis
MADVAIAAKREPTMTGTRRYAENLTTTLERNGVNVVPAETLGLPFTRAIGSLLPSVGARLDAFFANYPLGLRAAPARVLHLTMESLATALLTARWRGPIVVTVHDIISYLTRRDPELRAYAHAAHELFDLMSLRALTRADLLIADSTWTADAVSRHTGYPRGRIRVVPLAVDHEHFRPDGPNHPVVEAAAPGDGPIVGFVGALKARKNLTALVRAMPAIRARVPGARLLAAGPGDPAALERLRREAADLRLGDSVIHLGTLPDDAVPALYRRATVVVVPSLYEGFGLPALEAMACGAAVVASARASLPEVVADAGVLCEPDSNAIAAAVVPLLIEPPRRAQLAAAGVARARGFTWERTVAMTRAVYAEAVSGQSPAL